MTHRQFLAALLPDGVYPRVVTLLSNTELREVKIKNEA